VFDPSAISTYKTFAASNFDAEWVEDANLQCRPGRARYGGEGSRCEQWKYVVIINLAWYAGVTNDG